MHEEIALDLDFLLGLSKILQNHRRLLLIFQYQFSIISQILLKMQPSSKSHNIVYIISQNLAASHIEQLIGQLTRREIPLQLQTDYDSLGVPLDRRYFVIVDNLSGTVALGSWFNSLLLFIVGYPKKGHNKKNHYCNSTQQVLQKYQEFCKLPEFVKKIYLSSTVTSRSFLKSSSSFHSAPKAGSESSQIRKEEQRIQLNQKSKLFILSSQTDFVYNKWISKIAANSPKKVQVVESINDLQLSLSVCRCKSNFLLATSASYEGIPKQIIKCLKIILYGKMPSLADQILAICQTHKQIIMTIQKIGFDVVSLRDVEKSIVRYNNPFAKQLKSKSGKRIYWGSNSTSESDESDKILFGKQSIKIASTFPQNQIHNQLKSMELGEPVNSLSEPLGSISSISQHRYEDMIELEKKRSSIEGQVQQLSDVQKVKNRKLAQKKENLISQLEGFVITASSNTSQAIEKKSQLLTKSVKRPLKIKKIRCKSLQSQDLKNTQKTQFQLHTDFPSQYYSTKISQNQTSSVSLEKRSVSLEACLPKESIILRQKSTNSMTNSFPESVQNLKSQLKVIQRSRKELISSQVRPNWLKKKALTNTPQIVYKKNILQIQSQLISKRDLVKSQYLKSQEHINEISILIIWKDFNFNIQVSKDYLVKQLSHNSIYKSFYSEKELVKILSAQSNVNIVLLLDEVDLEKYLEICASSQYIKNIVGIYIFEKQTKISALRLQNIRHEVKSWMKEGKEVLIKCIQISDYIDESKDIARDLLKL